MYRYCQSDCRCHRYPEVHCELPVAGAEPLDFLVLTTLFRNALSFSSLSLFSNSALSGADCDIPDGRSVLSLTLRPGHPPLDRPVCLSSSPSRLVP